MLDPEPDLLDVRAGAASNARTASATTAAPSGSTWKTPELAPSRARLRAARRLRATARSGRIGATGALPPEHRHSMVATGIRVCERSHVEAVDCSRRWPWRGVGCAAEEERPGGAGPERREVFETQRRADLRRAHARQR